jgi:hypothetical protein
LEQSPVRDFAGTQKGMKTLHLPSCATKDARSSTPSAISKQFL